MVRTSLREQTSLLLYYLDKQVQRVMSQLGRGREEQTRTPTRMSRQRVRRIVGETAPEIENPGTRWSLQKKAQPSKRFMQESSSPGRSVDSTSSDESSTNVENCRYIQTKWFLIHQLGSFSVGIAELNGCPIVSNRQSPLFQFLPHPFWKVPLSDSDFQGHISRRQEGSVLAQGALRRSAHQSSLWTSLEWQVLPKCVLQTRNNWILWYSIAKPLLDDPWDHSK